MLSPADVAVLSGNANGNNNGWGDNGALWIILFLIFGWGRNGFGGNGFGSNGGVADNYVLATDFATIERKLDGVNNGICDSTFALNNTMTNGFAGVQQTLCQGFSGINQNITKPLCYSERGKLAKQPLLGSFQRHIMTIS